MNNSRKNEINAKLLRLAEYAKINNTSNNFHEVIYKYLRSYNIESERNLDIKYNFSSWIIRFQYKKT